MTGRDKRVICMHMRKLIKNWSVIIYIYPSNLGTLKENSYTNRSSSSFASPRRVIFFLFLYMTFIRNDSSAVYHALSKFRRLLLLLKVTYLLSNSDNATNFHIQFISGEIIYIMWVPLAVSFCVTY